MYDRGGFVLLGVFCLLVFKNWLAALGGGISCPLVQVPTLQH